MLRNLKQNGTVNRGKTRKYQMILDLSYRLDQQPFEGNRQQIRMVAGAGFEPATLSYEDGGFGIVPRISDLMRPLSS
jgi:hypothetical protein